MTAQVIFLNTGYSQDEEEENRLEAVQDALTLFHAEFAFSTREMDPIRVRVRKREAHLEVRKGLSVLTQ